MDPTKSLSEGFAYLSVGDQNPPHEPISRDTTSLTQVSSDRDLITDHDHGLLDAKLMKIFSAFRRLNEEPDLPSLLANITLEDKRLVTHTTEGAEGLLTDQPSIKQVLQDSWKKGSFKQVRQLSVLWPALVKSEKRRYMSDHSDLTNKALQSAWRDNYLGDNHRLLFSNINAIPRTEKPYSNQIAIVQSSGTGKSRMVHEQANLVFTIPFNLRDMRETQDLAFPAPDDAVRKYLVTTSFSDDQHILKTNYLKFLGSVFAQVNDELEKCRKEWCRKKTAEDLAKWWSSHLEIIRTRLYKAAVDGAGETNPILPEIRKGHEELLAKRRAEVEGFEDSELTTLVEFAAAEAAKASLGQLLSKLNGLVGSQQIQLIIYFDEAHPLTNVVPQNDDQKSLYDFLCSCLNQFVTLPIFCIFLSTNSSLAQFASPRALARSARIRGGKAVTHAPITETPFDCCGELMIKPGQLSMKDISTIAFMAKFGRPLFWTLLRGAGMMGSMLHREILELARAKLVNFREIDSNYDTFSHAAKLAVLDVQLSLDFEPRREKVQNEEASLVESHMRVAYSIPDHREYLRSGYPSEPLLAEAAAQQLWTWRQQRPFMVVDTLTSILETGLLNRGELGELTGRQLLLDAYHRAVEYEQPKQTPPNFSAGCRLITFIEMLFTKKCANSVLNSTPDNLQGSKFREAFKDALVCFTHFGKMADDTGITSAAAWAAFIRHMAIMCRNGQHTVDCVLPVLLWDTQLCEHVMTGVLVQFKRQTRSGTIAGLSIDQALVNFFPRTLEKCTHGSQSSFLNNHTFRRPYVSLIMELGVQPTTPEIATTPTIYKPSSSEKNVRPGTPPPFSRGQDLPTPSKICIPTYDQRHHPTLEGHPRYNLFAYGCSPTVYRGIDAAHKASYALLLSSRDFLGEHPRKSAETLKAVRRMKPFWNGGDDCYHWIEHNATLHGPVPPSREELLVGNQI